MNNNNGECLICFDDEIDKDKIVNCINTSCTATICEDCMELLIGHCKGEGIIPKCPNKKCGKFYIISQIKKGNKELKLDYSECCMKYYLKDQGIDVEKSIEQDEIIGRMRKDRIKFIKDTFPIAIGMVATIAFSDKLKRMEKKKKERIKEKLDFANRKCMNLYCNGFLKDHDKDYICMSCDTIFCIDCEKEKSNEVHKCKEEDVRALEYIRENMVHCPKCNTAVIKDVGCDSIKCAICDTLFEYSTGKEGGHGSSNKKVIIDNEAMRPSNMYKNIVGDEEINELLIIESKKPKDVVLNVDKYLKQYIIAEDDKMKQVMMIKLAKKLDQYMKSKMDNAKYNKYLIEIEKTINKKDDYGDLLIDVIRDIRLKIEEDF